MVVSSEPLRRGELIGAIHKCTSHRVIQRQAKTKPRRIMGADYAS
jgi:hypothetical protein